MISIFGVNGITQTVLVTFSMKMSRVSPGTLSSENDEFDSLKLRKT